MSPPLPYQLLADAVLARHVAIVVFVVDGPALVGAGNLRGWSLDPHTAAAGVDARACVCGA